MMYPRTPSWYSAINCCFNEAKWKSYFRVGRDNRFRKRCTAHGVGAILLMVLVLYRATEEYLEQFLFCCPLVKHTMGKEMFKKVDSFRNIRFCGLTACLFVPMVLGPWWEPKRFYEFMKKENKNIYIVIVFFTEKKSGSERNQGCGAGAWRPRNRSFSVEPESELLSKFSWSRSGWLI